MSKQSSVCVQHLVVIGEVWVRGSGMHYISECPYSTALYCIDAWISFWCTTSRAKHRNICSHIQIISFSHALTCTSDEEPLQNYFLSSHIRFPLESHLGLFSLQAQSSCHISFLIIYTLLVLYVSYSVRVFCFVLFFVWKVKNCW